MIVKKIIILFIGCLLTLSSCNKAKSKSEESTVNPSETSSDGAGQVPGITDESEITFDADNYDFKEIKKGDKVTHEFKFTNTGKKPLVISEVRPSCGCTTPEYTKEPVFPGKKGFITVTFDSSNFDGAVLKTIAVSGNFKTKVIQFQAKIK
ncbi:DUF1573 domain-containing protein [Apibacter sp. HY039]|uniref:DUF1573 domain-containing protein n=1 Tax=Apibacter sp. HY039 TaxID=2501476 RepID=UPI000FEBD1C6|nr:DUF1573 domain-containing protein [Apibacter sp. HY039]